MTRFVFRSLAATMLVSSTASFAFAAAVDLPGSATPDQLQRQLQIQNNRPTVGGAPLITTQDEGKKHISGNATFVLKHITIKDATAFKEEDLKSIYADKIGTKISVDELNDIVASITAYYRNHGYILTRAVLPPQHIEGGEVTIRIVEGYVNRVVIQGDKADDPLIQAYGDKIRASKPLDSAKLERYLLLMEDLPGVEVRAVLQPSTDTPGASDVVVNVTRKKVEFSASLDNRGSRFLGPLQLGLTGALDNFITNDDQTQVRFVNTPFDWDELVFGEVRHEEQLGTEGTRLVMSASEIVTRPGFSLEPLSIVGKSTAFSIGATHPIIRSRRENLFVNGDVTLRNVDVDTSGFDLYYDKTRVASLGGTYDFVDSGSAINRFEANASHGFNWGTKVENQPHSRANGEADFTKFTGKATRIQPISGPWSATFSASGQYSLDPLFASEEFALGGSEFGSAYDPAELTGDSGAAGRVELQYNDNWEGILNQYQLYGFYDIGQVWNRSPIAGSEADHQTLSSTGLGVRFNVNDAISGGLEGAVPLTKKVAAFGEDGADPRLFFNLLYRY